MVNRLANENIWADAKVIGFGETTHGTYEFRSTVFGVALRAAQQIPIVTIALEADPATGRDWNEWIGGCGHNGYGSKVALGPTAASYRAFFYEARRHNARGDGCIRVVGIDAPVNEYTLNVLAFYAKACLAPSAYDEVRSQVEELLAITHEFGPGADRGIKGLAAIGQYPQDQRIGNNCVDFDWWLHLSRQHIGIKRSAKMVAGLPEYVHSIDRDQLMGENVVFWSKRKGKVFWLSHAFHTAKVSIPPVRGHDDTTPAGLHVAEALGRRYVSVGMLFGEGTLYAIGCLFRSRGTVRRIPPPGRSCLQLDLHRTLSETALLPTQDACESGYCEKLRTYVNCLPRGWRDPKVAYLSIDVANAFDWIAYFPLVSADPFIDK